MVHYSTDPKVNALFLQAEAAGELDDSLYDLSLLDEPSDEEIDALAGMYETDCEIRAQEEIDRWYEEREIREADFDFPEAEYAPDALLDLEFEDRISG